MASKIKLRRDTAANWTFVNPVLSEGEPGIETDTGKIKYGNGSSNWNSLSYSSTTTATNVIGGIGSITQLSVSGITTLGEVQISSGIITATSGIVTYYGDGSKLTGIGITSVVNVGVVTYANQVAVTTYNGATSRVFEHYGTLTQANWTANFQNLNLLNNQATVVRIIGTTGGAESSLSSVQIDGTTSGVVSYGLPMKFTKNKTGTLVLLVVKGPTGSNYEVYGESTNML
jgi:hypothetical protein